ncbi:hypothetical protein [Amycolatopsis sp. NPDC004378]
MALIIVPENGAESGAAVLGDTRTARQNEPRSKGVQIDQPAYRRVSRIEDLEPVVEPVPVDEICAHPAADAVLGLYCRHHDSRICRDRAGAYAEGANTGAPEAIQVADRFHLWRNLGDHVEKAVARHRGCFKPEPPDDSTPPADAAEGDPAVTVSEPAESRLVTRTRERYAAVQDLCRRGESLSAICRILSLDRKTVRRFARAATVEELLGKAVGRSNLLDPFKPYLHQRWAEGVIEAAQLTKEISAQGFAGSEQTVRRYLHPFREMLTPPPAPSVVPKVRQVTGWLLRRPDDLDDDEKRQLADIRSRCPHLDRLTEHVKAFATMMVL